MGLADMERLGDELLKEVKLSIADISEDLPKNMEGFVIAPLIIDDGHEKALSLATKIISLLYTSSYKKIFVKDKEKLNRLMRLASEYLKQITLHIANEVKILEVDYITTIVVQGMKILALSVIARSSSMYEDLDEVEDLRGTVVILSSEKLRPGDVEKILNKAQDIADFYGSRLGFRVPNFMSTDDIRIVYFALEEEDVIKVKLKEDYGKPVTLRIPVSRPLWKHDDLPPKLREDIETLIVDPIKRNAKYAPRGLIIVGPPGVGKSVTAEALAHALGKGVVRITPSTYRSMWYGMTEKTLYKIFSAIKRRKDIIVIVDDADFLVQRLQAIHEAYIAEVNVWLNILQDSSRPFTVMTTNVPELIDPALIRPGRLDIAIVMGYPDREMRKKIIVTSCKRYGIQIDEKLVDEIVKISRWFNAAELDVLIRMAASKGRGSITEETIEWARRRFNINESERRHIQENLRYYASKLQSLVITYVPKESEI